MKITRLISLALVAVVCATGCGTPKIVLNNTSHGDRQILTSNLKLAHTGFAGNVYAAAGAKVSKTDTILTVLITSDADSDHSIFKQGEKFRIKFTDGKTLDLINIFDNEFEQDSGTRVTETMHTRTNFAYSYNPWTDDVYVTPYTVNTMVPQVSTYKESNSYAMYLISRPQAMTIASKEVARIRIETENGDVDINDRQLIVDVFSKLFECLLPVVEMSDNSADF